MEKMTKNDIMRLSAYGKVLYTTQPVKGLNHLNKVGYNSGVYGWNYDVYEYDRNVLMVGYRVPSFATYIEPKEVEKVAFKTLQEK